MEYTIAIIDEEDKQRNQFELVFENKFNVVKIDKVESIDNLIGQIKSEGIDAVAIDFRLTEHNDSFNADGDVFFKEIRKSLFEYPVFILTRSSEEVKKICKTVDPAFIIDKLNISYGKGEEAKEEAFLESIKAKIEVYRTNLNEKMQTLYSLEELRKNNPEEFVKYENDFINLNYEVGKYVGADSIVNPDVFSKQSNDKLDDLIAKTEALLAKLNKE